MVRATLPLTLVFAQVLITCVGARSGDGAHTAATAPTVRPDELRPPAAFAAAFPDRTPRSRALFLEVTRVLMHPRCANCHPDGDSPLQGDVPRPHDPPVLRGPADKGIVGMECASCHQDRNLELARVPGAPNWHLAPRTMAWVGKSPNEICQQIKDPKRNGERTLDRIVEHSARDELVGWAWAPGAGREPAPGNQALFGSIVQAWVDSGAECPLEEARR
jgi:hypothetical protein